MALDQSQLRRARHLLKVLEHEPIDENAAIKRSQLRRARHLLKVLEHEPSRVAAGWLVQDAERRPELAEAALANEAIRGMMAEWPETFSEASIRRSPIVRAEFEYTTVIGHAGESIAIGIRKNWGAFVGFEPLGAGDPVDPRHVLFIFKDNNPYNRRIEQRKALKRRLPRALRQWVNKALRSTRRDFLDGLPADVAARIRRAVGLDPIVFWRAAKGRTEVELPPVAVQKTMFGEPGTGV